MFQKTSLLTNDRICSVFQLHLSTWYLANDWISWWKRGSFPWVVTCCLLKLLKKWTVRRTAIWSQMNAPCKQLRSMKGPQCARCIRRDIGQGLRMLETVRCGCYGALLASGKYSSQLRRVYSCLWLTFVRSNLTRNLWEELMRKWGCSAWVLWPRALKFLKKGAAKLTARCSLMNVSCERLRIMRCWGRMHAGMFEFSKILRAKCLGNSWGKWYIFRIMGSIILIFWDFEKFYQIFLSPKVRRCAVTSCKHGIHE